MKEKKSYRLTRNRKMLMQAGYTLEYILDNKLNLNRVKNKTKKINIKPTKNKSLVEICLSIEV